MTIVVARQLPLRPFPHGTETPGPLGDHIMGMAVLGWLTEHPVAAWGESWMRHGTLHATFTRPVVAGQSLDMDLIMGETTVDVSYVDADGRPCVTGRATIGTKETRDQSALDLDIRGTPITVRLAPLATALEGAVMPPMTFSFDARRDLAFLDGQADASAWTERGWAHPAWLGTATNATIMRNIDFASRDASTGRWQQVAADAVLCEPIVDGDEVTMHSHIGRISTRGRRAQHHVAHLECNFRVGRRTAARFTNTFVFATDDPSPDPPHP